MKHAIAIAIVIAMVCCMAHAAQNRAYCRVANGGTGIEYAPDLLWPSMTPPTAEVYRLSGWLKNSIQSAPSSNGYHVAAVRYEARDGRIFAVYEYEANAPVVRRWTPLAIKRSAMRLGKWDALKQFLVAAGAYDDFIMAQYEAEDDADFIRLIEAARAQLGAEAVDAVLNGAEVE